MGACYSVIIKVKLIDENKAVDKLKAHITQDKNVNYSLDKYAKIGAVPDTFDNLMRILLAEHQQKVSILQDEDFKIYENDFNASYGWERVMVEWFELMSEFLVDGSQLIIYPDNGYEVFEIQEGKCEQIR